MKIIMDHFVLCSVFLLAGVSAASAQNANAAVLNETRTIATRVVKSTTAGVCPFQDKSVYDNITEEVRSILRNILDPTLPSCGEGAWTRVAYIDMNDTSYQCPGDWELTNFAVRTCARTIAANSGGCNSATFSTGGKQYSRVCGRMVGYQYGATSAFYFYNKNPERTIEDVYCDGVSLTHGPAGSREHIWTFAVGYVESPTAYAPEQCPCDAAQPVNVPPYVGSDYFCESGAVSSFGGFHADDPLWDGDNCVDTSTCCIFNNPPWFTKALPAPTTNDLEMRICDDYTSEGVTAVEFVELYIL